MHCDAIPGVPSVQDGHHSPTKFRVSNHVSRHQRGSLVDRGANGGLIGQDAIVFHQHLREVDVSGIDNHEITGLKMVNASARIITHKGPAIGIFNQYAYHGIGRTIHSSGQLEHYKNKVDDRSRKVNGKQCIRTVEGLLIPLDIINGLPYLKMQPNTKKEWEELPHVIFTSGEEWDPTIIDNTISDQEDWYVNIIEKGDELPDKHPFDQFGNYKGRQPPKDIQIMPEIGEQSEEEEEEEINFHEIYRHASDLNQRFLCYELEANDKVQLEVKEPTEIKASKVNYEDYRPYFLNVPLEKVRRTFQVTTQYATNVMSGQRITQTIKSPFPANNVWRRNEPVASDTVFAAVPAVCTNGHTMAQIFVGRKSLVIDVHSMGTEAEFVNTLEDQIRKRGAMDKLVTDSAKVEMSNRVLDILRSMCIGHHKSEPNYQHQDFAEHRWRHCKGNVNHWMNFRNVPENAWFLCTEWVADVMNHTAEKSLGWRPPLQVLTGQTVDISCMLIFLFWDVVYVTRHKDSQYNGEVGSTKSSEIRGRFVGFAWDVGHALTFKILTDDTKKIICRSRVRLAKDGENNLKLEAEAGNIPQRVYIQSKRDGDPDSPLPTIDMEKDPFEVYYEDDKKEDGEKKEPSPMDDPPLSQTPVVETVDEDEDLADHLKQQRGPHDPNPNLEPRRFDTENLATDLPTEPGLPPERLIDRTFLMPANEDGTRVRAKIIEAINLHKDGMKDHPELVKFKCLVNDEYEDVVAYNDIVDYIEQDQTWDGVWKFRKILSHKKVDPKDPDYKGSSYNLLLEWETGQVTSEPLWTGNKHNPGIYAQDRVTVAIYARENGLLNTKGWKLPGIKKLAKTQQRMVRHANQAKLHSFRTKPVYMYGFLVPRNHQQAVEIDRENSNTKWQDSEKLELSQLQEYETFVNKGRGYNPGPDWKRIRCHIVYAVKHDGRHKSRVVAGGHLTDTPIDSVYSSVVSLRGIRMLCFLAELNDMEVWCTDIGNAYLETYTQEKVYIVAGQEFGELAGCTLLISKALYGLKSSGLRWHERFSDVLRSMGFFPSKAERDIWMRDKGDHYEYIGVYVDDLLIASKNPQAIVDTLMNDHKFKLKGTGPISFHLGCDFFRDEEDTLCLAPRKYIDKMLDNYVRIFGSLPRKAHSPLVQNDHPELDTSDLLEYEDIKIYQSLIGALQWVIQIGRWDITTSVMTMSRFRAAPRIGHLERVKRIHGFLRKFKHGVLRICTDVPDYSDVPEKVYDWSGSCYPGAKEEIPDDIPTPRGKSVVSTHWVDANLYHDMVSGRSVTGILHMWNKFIIDWYSKLQSTVETATFGSEYVAARTCTEQILDLRLTARYLGVPVEGPAMMFGDNESVVNTASVPHSRLVKRHNALSYHKTRESIAAKTTRFTHCRGKTNPSDILSKHWDMPSVWDSLKPLMFYKDGSREDKDDRDDSPDSSRGVKDV